jgi:hypothetical protein
MNKSITLYETQADCSKITTSRIPLGIFSIHTLSMIYFTAVLPRLWAAKFATPWIWLIYQLGRVERTIFISVTNCPYLYRFGQFPLTALTTCEESPSTLL